jgi:hypothetical protein
VICCCYRLNSNRQKIFNAFSIAIDALLANEHRAECAASEKAKAAVIDSAPVLDTD